MTCLNHFRVCMLLMDIKHNVHMFVIVSVLVIVLLVYMGYAKRKHLQFCEIFIVRWYGDDDSV